MLQRIAQLRAGSAERPAAGRRARHGGEQEPAPPLHQHNCLGSAAPPAGLAPPTSCDQIRPEKAFLNLGRLAGLGISSRPHLHCRAGRPPPSAQAGAPDGFAGTNRPRGPVPFTPRSEGDGDEMLGNPSVLPGKCVCDVGEDTSRFLSTKSTLVLDPVNHTQSSLRHFIKFPQVSLLAS